MKYRDGEFEPELGDFIHVYADPYPPEGAFVTAVGKKTIKAKYEDQSPSQPSSEWISPEGCDLIAREN